MTGRLLERATDVCRRRGYDVERPDKPWLPPAVCEPTADAEPFTRAPVAPVGIEPLAVEDVTPTTVLSRLRNNARHDRFTLFVVADEGGRRCLDVLRDPPLVDSEDASGARTFYTGPDRVLLSGGGYAACRTDTAAFTWRETAENEDENRHGADRMQLLLEDDGRVVAVLDGVTDLCCRPDPARFPYRYVRGEDKRFHVAKGSGETVGVYSTLSGMRANAYVPVPMPLVPEELFDGVGSVGDAWAVLVVDDGSTSVLTADS